MNNQISRKKLEEVVVHDMNLSLVQFKTEWSGACQIISPIYEELAKSYKGAANFFYIDVEEEIGVDKDYGVMEFPTILFFKNGEVIDHAVGLVPRNVLIMKIENALAVS